MNLFNLFDIGQQVKVVIYEDEVDAIPTHYHSVGIIDGIVCDFYRVDFGETVEIIDVNKLHLESVTL